MFKEFAGPELCVEGPREVSGPFGVSRSPFWKTPWSVHFCLPRQWTLEATEELPRGPVATKVTGALIIGGMCGLCLGAYALLDGSLAASLGLPAFLGGTVLCCAGLYIGGRRVRRSQYRPDPWRTPEWIVTVSGLLPAAIAFAGVGFATASLNPSTQPIEWPSLPLLPAIAILLAAVGGGRDPPACTFDSGQDRGGERARHDVAFFQWRRQGVNPSRAPSMIEFDNVTVTYPEGPGPVLRGVTMEIIEGELALVVGQTGVGKSTLLGTVNGLVPHFTGGTLAGRVVVDGRDTRTHPPRELADVVGVVGQDPLAGFVTDTVEEELAYSMEQLGLPAGVMRKRVEETLDLLGIAGLRDRALHQLSGGEQQRVAIGSVLTSHPRVLVLDEPTSALDPTAAEEGRQRQSPGSYTILV